jgi:hypothetical protein
LTEIAPHQENGETWRTLRVTFPPTVPTHSEEQTFYFDSQGLLQRLDYVAVGPVAHYCYDHASFKGIVFPTFRRVVQRPTSGPQRSGPTHVWLQISDILVT